MPSVIKSISGNSSGISSTRTPILHPYLWRSLDMLAVKARRAWKWEAAGWDGPEGECARYVMASPSSFRAALGPPAFGRRPSLSCLACDREALIILQPIVTYTHAQYYDWGVPFPSVAPYRKVLAWRGDVSDCVRGAMNEWTHGTLDSWAWVTSDYVPGSSRCVLWRHRLSGPWRPLHAPSARVTHRHSPRDSPVFASLSGLPLR